MPLSDTSLRAIKPSDKVQKISDGGGLYLHVTPAGSKLWRMAYRFGGKQKTLSFGSYPAVGLKEARASREEAKALLADGIDPSEEKKRIKVATASAEREQAMTFESVGYEWFERKTGQLSDGYRKRVLARLENNLFPAMCRKPFSELEPSDLVEAVKPSEDDGKHETAHRLMQLAGQICRYARLMGYSRYDVSSGLNEALMPKPRVEHRAAITDPARIGTLLRDIEAYSGDISVMTALRIIPYVFIRSGELRNAEWSEIDLSAAEWVIPAGRMKMHRPHVVPLARQVVKLFAEIREWSGSFRIVFPSPFSQSRCISDMALLNAIRRMGYGKDEMSVHGFRSMASTLLNERGYRPDVIEAQLAHGERNNIRAAYNHAQYLPERRQMMQEWADYLDSLRDSAGGGS